MRGFIRWRGDEAGDVVLFPAGVEHATYNPNQKIMRAIIIKSPPDSKGPSRVNLDSPLMPVVYERGRKGKGG